jgi:hypothetical protein
MARLKIAESWSKDLDDLALFVAIDDELVMIVAEGPETPWFLEEELHKNIKDWGARRTLYDICRFLTHSVDEIRREVSR